MLEFQLAFQERFVRVHLPFSSRDPDTSSRDPSPSSHLAISEWLVFHFAAAIVDSTTQKTSKSSKVYSSGYCRATRRGNNPFPPFVRKRNKDPAKLFDSLALRRERNMSHTHMYRSVSMEEQPSEELRSDDSDGDDYDEWDGEEYYSDVDDLSEALDSDSELVGDDDVTLPEPKGRASDSFLREVFRESDWAQLQLAGEVGCCPGADSKRHHDIFNICLLSGSRNRSRTHYFRARISEQPLLCYSERSG